MPALPLGATGLWAGRGRFVAKGGEEDSPGQYIIVVLDQVFLLAGRPRVGCSGLVFWHVRHFLIDGIHLFAVAFPLARCGEVAILVADERDRAVCLAWRGLRHAGIGSLAIRGDAGRALSPCRDTRWQSWLWRFGCDQGSFNPTNNLLLSQLREEGPKRVPRSVAPAGTRYGTPRTQLTRFKFFFPLIKND